MSTETRQIKDVSSKKKKSITSVFRFFGETKREFNTLSWTDKKELITATKVILISTFVSGFSVYFVDLLIQRLLSGINLLTQMIFG